MVRIAYGVHLRKVYAIDEEYINRPVEMSRSSHPNKLVSSSFLGCLMTSAGVLVSSCQSVRDKGEHKAFNFHVSCSGSHGMELETRCLSAPVGQSYVYMLSPHLLFFNRFCQD